jgi:hypothetical protein
VRTDTYTDGDPGYDTDANGHTNSNADSHADASGTGLQ